jgi:hypothetical protein
LPEGVEKARFEAGEILPAGDLGVEVFAGKEGVDLRGDVGHEEGVFLEDAPEVGELAGDAEGPREGFLARVAVLREEVGEVVEIGVEEDAGKQAEGFGGAGGGGIGFAGGGDDLGGQEDERGQAAAGAFGEGEAQAAAGLAGGDYDEQVGERGDAAGRRAEPCLEPVGDGVDEQFFRIQEEAVHRRVRGGGIRRGP